MFPLNDETRPAARQGLWVGFATGLYGLSFGALAVPAGLSVWQAVALSALLFSGGSQFALIGVLASGGSGVAAVQTFDAGGAVRLDARAAGLVPFCVTIDQEANQYLPRLFGAQGYALVHRPEQLARALTQVYIRLTATVI